jgi:non-homologous end joining protein Ku
LKGGPSGNESGRLRDRPSRPNRPFWKGYLRLALVTIPVQIHNATESSKVALHQIHKPSGQRANYTVSAGGKEVDKNEIVRGYPVAEDVYVTLEDEELDAIKLETKKTLDLQEFVKEEETLRPSSSVPSTSSRKMNMPKKAIRSFMPH